MSDDELPPTGAAEGMEDDFSDDDGGDYDPPAELPDGIKKEILTPAPHDSWKKPKAGDDVTVHYVGTLESDGSEFDSSRGRGDPFVFGLGKGQVIKGWDLGVATMKKGEVAKFTLTSEFAYGAAGSPPKIPENATLVFEVELLSWASKDDLFGDEGVIKMQIKEGSGWKSPKTGDEVLIDLKAVGADGAVIEERKAVDYTLGSIGSNAFGAIEKVIDKALMGMKKGEEAELKCTEDYAYPGKGAATISLTCKEIYETKDVSFEKDKSVMKKQIKAGEGYETPKDSAQVKLVVESATDGSTLLPGFISKTLQFTVGNGEVCDALECAVGNMKKGEKAVLTVTRAALFQDAQLGLGSLKADKVVAIVELTEFDKGKDTWSMSEEEKVEFGAKRKEVGTTLFKGGRLGMALQRYKQVCDLFATIDKYKEENRVKATELKKSCDLNMSACYLKLQNFTEAKTACNKILKDERQNVKAMYRRAQAEFGLKNYTECIQDCKSVVIIDAQNREARALLKQAQAGQKEVDKEAKGLFANMCKALGKGPIPEPGKSKPVEGEGDDFDDEDEDDMPMGDEELNAAASPLAGGA